MLVMDRMLRYFLLVLNPLLTRSRRRGITVISALTAIILLAIIVLSWPMNISPYMCPPSSGEMVDRSGRLMYAFLNEDENWCFPRELSDISPRLVEATIAAEDQRFYFHPGVDPIAVVRAAWQNLTSRRIVSGASTLAMQVVKIACRRDEKKCGKLFQAIEAFRLQVRVGREGILQTYLNTAPYGGNLIGCESAARRYYGKPAKELTLPEAAFLAGLPKAPGLYSPFRNPERALARRNYVLDRMHAEGFISEPEYREAKKQPLGVQQTEFPKLAPHLAMQLVARSQNGQKIETTLNAEIQIMVESLVKNAVGRTDGEIENAATVVVDVDTAEVLARVGSADFFHTPGGQVDACRALRSPGSALKPFTYGLAMEKNVLYACETLLDDAWDRGRYKPENFDFQYHGLVPASDALKRSLNVPAVIAVQRVGIDNLCLFLKRMGLTSLVRQPREYGLGLTLGSCEARLEELAAAYCALANLGEYRPLKIRTDEPDPPRTQMLSRGTCLKLYEMLEQPLPMELDYGPIRFVNTPPRVCWKTGTSWGLRDAWCFVFNSHYVVGVWMGNNDSRSSSRLVGARSALPLAARIFRSLPRKNVPAWPETDGALREVSVCGVSGLPASRWCLHTRNVFLPRNQYLHRICDMHYPAPVENLKISGMHPVIERRPGSPQDWDLAAIRSPVMARLDSNEVKSSRHKDLNILEPSHHAEYLLTGEPNGDQIRLRSSVDDQVRLHWYLDDRYFGHSEPQKPLLLKLETGEHCLTCMTPDAKIHTVSYKVFSP